MLLHRFTNKRYQKVTSLHVSRAREVGGVLISYIWLASSSRTATELAPESHLIHLAARGTPPHFGPLRN